MILELRKFSAGYGDNAIVRSVDTSFASGCITGLIGPNGAGKSTLLKSLFGTARILGGQVFIDGIELKRISPRELLDHGVAYVPQLRNVFPTLSVRENLEMGMVGRGRSSIDKALAVFTELTSLLDRQAGKLSGGQRNMVAVARALVSEPQLLLVDEGSAGLAPQVVETYWRHLSKLVEGGTGVVAVEQNVNVALEYASKMYLMVGGEVKLEGTAREFAERTDLASMFLGADTRVQRD